jgi:hypothetical protein
MLTALYLRNAAVVTVAVKPLLLSAPEGDGCDDGKKTSDCDDPD